VTTTATGTRPAWTLTEAVERTGASRSTLRRYRDAGKFPHAYKDSSGVWRFPVPDLLAAGFRFTDPAQRDHLSTSSEHVQPEPEQPPADHLNTATQAELEAAREALAKVREQLATAEQRAAVAEAVAAERERMIQTQAMALRMLEAGKGAQREHPVQPAQQAVSVATDHPVTARHDHPEQPSVNMEKDGRQPVPFLRRLLGR
jgi:hypothetical protein